jgi:hypothetical protein
VSRVAVLQAQKLGASTWLLSGDVDEQEQAVEERVDLL